MFQKGYKRKKTRNKNKEPIKNAMPDESNQTEISGKEIID